MPNMKRHTKGLQTSSKIPWIDKRKTNCNGFSTYDISNRFQSREVKPKVVTVCQNKIALSPLQRGLFWRTLRTIKIFLSGLKAKKKAPSRTVSSDRATQMTTLMVFLYTDGRPIKRISESWYPVIHWIENEKNESTAVKETDTQGLYLKNATLHQHSNEIARWLDILGCRLTPTTGWWISPGLNSAH